MSSCLYLDYLTLWPGQNPLFYQFVPQQSIFGIDSLHEACEVVSDNPDMPG